MERLDLIGRIRRTIQARVRRIYGRKWRQLQPQDFYADRERINRIWYMCREGKRPNFDHPTDFNERLMAINMNNFRDERMRKLIALCADKYAVREYVEKKGLGDILVECYGVFDSFDEIDFDKLPNQFVIKTTNASGQNYICLDKSKIDIPALKDLFEKWMSESKDFGLTTGEWHYSLIKPRIIIEKYMSMFGEDMSLVDYKFHCINNQVYGEYVCYDRDNTPGSHTVNYDHYDAEWNLTDGVLSNFHPKQRLLPKPQNFEKMKEIAEALSSEFEYVRVDLYNIEGKIYFGELTFTPMGNYLPYTHKQLVDMEQFYNRTKRKSR